MRKGNTANDDRKLTGSTHNGNCTIHASRVYMNGTTASHSRPDQSIGWRMCNGAPPLRRNTTRNILFIIFVVVLTYITQPLWRYRLEIQGDRVIRIDRLTGHSTWEPITRK